MAVGPTGALSAGRTQATGLRGEAAGTAPAPVPSAAPSGAKACFALLLYLVLDGPRTVVQVVAVSQHVHDLPVPKQRDVVPRLGLWGQEEKEALLVHVTYPSTPFLPSSGWEPGHHGQRGAVPRVPVSELGQAQPGRCTKRLQRCPLIPIWSLRVPDQMTDQTFDCL